MEEININLGLKDDDDVIFKKIFSIEFKGKKITKAILLNDLSSIFLLYNNIIYFLNIEKKQLNKFNFCDNNEIINIFPNCNNSYILILYSNGKILSTDKNKLIQFENNVKIQYNLQEIKRLKIYASEDLFKMIIIEKEKICLYYTNKILNEEINVKIKKHQQFSTIIHLENERKNLINNLNYFENFDVIFGNSMYNGNFVKIIYSIIEYINEIKAYKIYLIEYTFLFEQVDRNNFLNSKPTYYKKYFNSKYVYSYFKREKEDDDKNKHNLEQNILIKSNKTGTCTAFIIYNCPEINKINLIIFNNETYKFSFLQLEKLFGGIIEDNLTITDFDWLSNNDIFIFIQFSNYSFTILNTVTLKPYIINNKFMRYKEIEGIYILKYYNDLSSKFEKKQKIFLQTNIRVENNILNEEDGNNEISTLFLYSNSYIIFFDISTFSFDNKIINLSTEDSFEKFLISLKYFQSYYIKNEEKRNFLEEQTHDFIFSHFSLIFPSNNTNLYPELIDLENSMAAAQDENLAQALDFYVNFIRIFQNINQYHSNDLSLISFLIIVSNDFFFYLLSLKEIWLSYLFLELSEKYLLSNLQLKKDEEINNFDKEKLTNQKIYFLFNPKFANASSIKCYNKISNISLFSKLRVLLFFYSLVEFRNSQALNINVLYFILAKISIEELKRNNLMDDVNFLLKLLIQNWKFLKSENQKAGNAEFVLNNFSQNFISEILNFGKKRIDDKQFSYLTEIYTEENIMIFNDINNKYCIKDEETDDNIINDFSSLDNDIGIIQKWHIYFKNFFYEDLFDDLNQYHEINKDNKICNFRLFFFITEIQLYTIEILKIFISNKNHTINNIKMISPIDIPFIIYEYSFVFDNNIKDFSDIFSHDFHLSLILLINRYLKNSQIQFKEGLEFFEYLMMKGFNTIEKNDNIKKYEFQPYIFSSILFILISILKVNSYIILDKYFDIIHQSVSLLKKEYKEIIYSCMIYIIKYYIQYYSDIGKKYLFNHMLKLFLLYNKIFESIIENNNLENLLIYFLYEARVPDIKNFFEEKIIYYSYQKIKNIFKEKNPSNINIFLKNDLVMKTLLNEKIINYFFSNLNNFTTIEKFSTILFSIKEKFISFEEQTISTFLKNFYSIKLLYYLFLIYLKEKILKNKKEKDYLCYISLFLCFAKNQNYIDDFQKQFEPNRNSYQKIIGEDNINIIIKNIYYSKLIFKEIEENINKENKLGNKIQIFIILSNNNYFIKIFSSFINELNEILKEKKIIFDKEAKENLSNLRKKIIDLNTKLSQIFGVLDNYSFQYNELFETGNYNDLMNYINGKTINLGGIQNSYLPSLKDYEIIIQEYEKQINLSHIKQKNMKNILLKEIEVREEKIENIKLKIKPKINKQSHKIGIYNLIEKILIYIYKKILQKIFIFGLHRTISLNHLNLVNSDYNFKLFQMFINSNHKKSSFNLYKLNPIPLQLDYEKKMIFNEMLNKEKDFQINYLTKKFDIIKGKIEKLNNEINKI